MDCMVHEVTKSQTQLSDFHKLNAHFFGEGNGNPLQWVFLAWKILWTEEPGGLWSMGLQRVGHN